MECPPSLRSPGVPPGMLLHAQKIHRGGNPQAQYRETSSRRCQIWCRCSTENYRAVHACGSNKLNLLYSQRARTANHTTDAPVIPAFRNVLAAARVTWFHASWCRPRHRVLVHVLAGVGCVVSRSFQVRSECSLLWAVHPLRIVAPVLYVVLKCARVMQILASHVARAAWAADWSVDEGVPAQCPTSSQLLRCDAQLLCVRASGT